MNNLILLWGLPGSGKTHFAKHYHTLSDRERSNIHIIHVDEIMEKFSGVKNSKEKILASFQDILRNLPLDKGSDIVVDSLIVNNKVAKYVLENSLEVLNDPKITIYFWEEDRDACLFNDLDRRDKGSLSSINKTLYEEPSQSLQDHYKLKIVRMKVMKKMTYKQFVKKYDISEKLTSGSWCTGGMSGGDCWGGTPQYSVEADEECEFVELDSLLEEICPTITFLQYKKILSECVKTEESRDNDYYGNYTNHKNFVCDTKKLYDFLSRRSLINNS